MEVQLYYVRTEIIAAESFFCVSPMNDVVGYDLAAFFKRNSEMLRTEIDAVLKALLEPEATA